MFLEDLFPALGLPKARGFLQEAVRGKSPTNTEPSPTLVPWEYGAVVGGGVIYY